MSLQEYGICGDASETESSNHGGELISTVHSGSGQKWKTSVKASSTTGYIQREVGSSEISHKHEYGELPLQDMGP